MIRGPSSRKVRHQDVITMTKLRRLLNNPRAGKEAILGEPPAFRQNLGLELVNLVFFFFRTLLEMQSTISPQLCPQGLKEIVWISRI